MQDFRSLDLRPDKGGIFENFIVSEIEKKKKIKQRQVNTYFYREYGGKELIWFWKIIKKNIGVLKLSIRLKSQRRSFHYLMFQE